MFERFDTWLVMALAAFALFCGLYVWIVDLYQKIKELKNENKRIRHELNEKQQENTWLLARCESLRDHRSFIRGTEVDKLTAEIKTKDQRIKELETLLEQKWKGAKAK